MVQTYEAGGNEFIIGGERVLGKHKKNLSGGNGGEALTLQTVFVWNGDREQAVFVNQTLSLESYCNAAHFELVGAILTPKLLRELANELESSEILANG